MNGIWRIAAFTLVIFSTSLYAANLGKISGWVNSDEGSKGIQEAVVYFYTAAGEISDSVYSHSNGWFEKHLAAGDYLVSAEKGNYIREFYPGRYSVSEAKSIHISPGQIVTISFALERGGWIGGSFDIVGEDIQKGLAIAIKQDQPDEGWYQCRTVSGSFPQNYALLGLIPGVYKVMAQATSKGTIYYPGVTDPDDAATIEVDADNGVADISFLMEPVGSGLVTGRIFDEQTGAGLADVPVIAYQWQDSRDDPNLRMTASETDGSFRLHLTSGSYILYARCQGCLPGSEDVSIFYDNKLDPLYADPLVISDGDALEGIDFRFDLSDIYNLSVAGRILDDQNGEGLGGVLVEAVDYNTGRTLNSAYSVGSGEFAIDNLSSGVYLIAFSQMNVIPYFYHASEVWQDAEVVELTVDYRGIQTEAITQDYGNLGLSITGHVTARAEPLHNARIYAYPVGEDEPVAFARTNASGEYTIIRGLVPGFYTVVCDLFGYNYETYPEIIELDLLNNPDAPHVDFNLEQPTTEVTADFRTPELLRVMENYPNPFNERTVLQIYSGYSESIDSRIVVYDILGRNVGSKSITVDPGINHIGWGLDDFSRSVSSGIYFYKIDDFNHTFRMVLLK